MQMRRNRIAAIIIAAGYSSRMDSFKPLLKFKDMTAIERLIRTYQSAGIRDIYVVVGHRREEIIDKLADLEIEIVFNEAYDEGMFSSVKKGVFALDEKVGAFFMQPVDIPLIKQETLQLLMNCYMSNEKGIIYPTFCEQKGHPPLIDCKYNSFILNSNGEGGLKRILESLEEDACYVPVYDNTVLMDMDKKEDYEKLVEYEKRNAPNHEECIAIMKHYKVEEHIIKHCEAVCGMAGKIYHGVSLNGISLDENALLAAALLHDIARKEKNHAVVGANIIRELGYSFVGDIIESHKDIKVCEEEKLSEKEILYLADKLVKEDRVCDMKERYEQLLEEYIDNPKAYEKIKKRWLSAKMIIRKIAKINLLGLVHE
jgi:putative nucleotidyltransferase with HDIG domain